MATCFTIFRVFIYQPLPPRLRDYTFRNEHSVRVFLPLANPEFGLKLMEVNQKELVPMRTSRLVLPALLAAPLLAHALTPGDGDNPTVPAPGASCDTNQLTPGETNRTINVDGVRREYILYVPDNYSGNNDVPLLLDFHPLSSSSDYQRNNSGTAEVADNEGFIVAYPQGIDNTWNFGPCCTESRDVDDVAFARAVVDSLSGEACVDEKRVYATGYSNGGGMSYKLACDAADTFAAVAPAAFDMVEGVACNPSRPVPVFSARGRFDFIVPYSGGESRPPTSYPLEPITFLGAEGSFEKWGELNNCSGEPTDISSSCKAYTDCEADSEVVLCTANFGSHSAWDAEQSWDFLKDHSLPD